MKPPRILITAGPTHEPIDAVRYIANRSSGRMGLALAEETVRRGFKTTLLLGPTALKPPDHSLIRVIRFQTTADLQSLLHAEWPNHDVLFMAAAVADYRPAHGRLDEKLRRGAAMSLQLEPTPDLLAELAEQSRPDQRIIGFALEPADRLLESAREKLARKRVHAIVANPLETMDSESVTASVVLHDGRVIQPDPAQTKSEFAKWLMDQLPVIVG